MNILCRYAGHDWHYTYGFCMRCEEPRANVYLPTYDWAATRYKEDACAPTT